MSTRVKVVAGAVSLLLCAGVGLAAASLSGSGGSNVAAAGASSAGPAPVQTPLTPQDRCVATVVGLLEQVPEARREGYDGVSVNSLITDYGMDSAEVQTFERVQGELIGSLIRNGGGEAAVGRFRGEVVAGCANASS